MHTYRRQHEFYIGIWKRLSHTTFRYRNRTLVKPHRVGMQVRVNNNNNNKYAVHRTS